MRSEKGLKQSETVSSPTRRPIGKTRTRAEAKNARERGHFPDNDASVRRARDIEEPERAYRGSAKKILERSVIVDTGRPFPAEDRRSLEARGGKNDRGS